jgi:hypothetical protein
MPPDSQLDEPQPDSAGEHPGSGALGKFARRAARAAKLVRDVAEEHRPQAEQAARDASQQVRRAADAAKPEVERLAREAKAVADTALPHVEKAANDGVNYVREHGDEIRGAAGSAGKVVARGITPAPLRPAVDAFERELTRKGDAESEEPAAGKSDDDGNTDGDAAAPEAPPR